MTKTLLDLPDDVLLELLSRYLPVRELGRLERVCQRFHSILTQYTLPWKKALARVTNVSQSHLNHAVGCPTFENLRHPPSIPAHPLSLPTDYQYEILFDHSSRYSPYLPNDFRRPLNPANICSKLDCDRTRLQLNSRHLLRLAYHWKKKNLFNHTLVKFVRRAQTSLIQYDEHQHQLWLSYDQTLACLNLDRNGMDHSYTFAHDDVLCYKIYNDDLLGLVNGNTLRLICRQTDEIYSCATNAHIQGERDDLLCIDIYSNDQSRYLILNGSRDHTVSMRMFDMSTRRNELIWRTRVDDRVLCSRFTSDGEYALIGTGGTSSLHPLVLFNTERARPMHLYNSHYRLGAGIRCIEWASPNVFIAAGFDNQFKEFDLRTGLCHYTFNDEFANDYCSLAVSADHDHVANGIVLGGNHHSTVRLVNRRKRQTENVYFVSKQASPVHSLAVTSEYLFASIDRSIVALDFTRSNMHFGRINYRI